MACISVQISSVYKTQVTGKDPVLILQSINCVSEDQNVVSCHDVHGRTRIDEALLIGYHDRIEEDLRNELLESLVVMLQKLCNAIVRGDRKEAASSINQRLGFFWRYA